jgi:hypothetical protein
MWVRIDPLLNNGSVSRVQRISDNRRRPLLGNGFFSVPWSDLSLYNEKPTIIDTSADSQNSSSGVSSSQEDDSVSNCELSKMRPE